MPTIKGFQWNARKNQANLRKHGIDFDEAVEVFYAPHFIRRSHHQSEERWIAVGVSEDRVITVVFTWRDDEVRIISARRARKDEERAYRQESLE